MKTRIALLVLIVSFLFVGCATIKPTMTSEQQFTYNAYQVLNKSKIVYDTITDGFIDLRGQGLIDDGTWDRFIKYADIYADAHNAAVSVLYTYEVTKDPTLQRRVTTHLEALTKALADLVGYAQPYLEKHFIKT